MIRWRNSLSENEKRDFEHWPYEWDAAEKSLGDPNERLLKQSAKNCAVAVLHDSPSYTCRCNARSERAYERRPLDQLEKLFFRFSNFDMSPGLYARHLLDGRASNFARRYASILFDNIIIGLLSLLPVPTRDGLFSFDYFKFNITREGRSTRFLGTFTINLEFTVLSDQNKKSPYWITLQEAPI